jgi:hypothetical protein
MSVNLNPGKGLIFRIVHIANVPQAGPGIRPSMPPGMPWILAIFAHRTEVAERRHDGSQGPQPLDSVRVSLGILKGFRPPARG